MEEKKSVQHIQVPDPTNFNDLKPTDRLVYANMRRFMNKDTYQCYPSMLTVAKHCGIAPDTVAKSIKRLVKFGYITILDEKHNGKNNIYQFNKMEKDFERFTSEFLDNDTMTPNEKAYLIGLQSQCYKENGFALTTYSNYKIAEALNTSENFVRRYNTSLKTKEIMHELKSAKLDEYGFNKIVKAIDLDKIGQKVLFEVAINHEDRIQQLEKMVQILLHENNELKKRLEPQKEIMKPFAM